MSKRKTPKKKAGAMDYFKASRKGSREAEIELYGRPLPRFRVHISRKTYNRKKTKAGLKESLP